MKRRFLPPTVITGFGEAVDGDSLKVGGEMVRLKGVDAPEFNQSCQDAAGRAYDCGAEARRWLQARLRRGSVRCEIDGRDRYGRPLGWCVVAEESLNAAIVRAGLAVDYGGHAAEEREARRLRAGCGPAASRRPRSGALHIRATAQRRVRTDTLPPAKAL